MQELLEVRSFNLFVQSTRVQMCEVQWTIQNQTLQTICIVL